MHTLVLDGHAADQGDPAAWDEIQSLGSLTVLPRIAAGSSLVDLAAGADAVITNKVVLDAKTLRGLPRLRYIGVSATGTNVVDLDVARAGGIAVTNVPGYSTESVAQLVFALILHLGLDVAGHAAAVKQGQWAACPDFCFFLRPLPELAGKTLAIVGRGAIGNAVARIAAGFGMNVVAAQVPGTTPKPDRLPLELALAGADVVTLHCPLTPATAQMVDTTFLERMKPGAYLINTSRGGLVDQAALRGALERGHLGGVGLDVLVREPPDADDPLLNPDAAWAGRVVVTPHLAWGTVESRARLRSAVAANLAAFQSGQRLNRVD